MKNIALLIINKDQNEFEKHTLPIIGLNILTKKSETNSNYLHVLKNSPYFCKLQQVDL